MITDADVDLVAGRLNAWSIALAGLADPDACRQFLTVLDEADGKALHKLIDRWNLPGEVGCVEIIDTITRFVHTGDYKAVETCSFVNKLRPPNPSTTSGVGYQLPDGTVLWLTESEWWQMMDRAVERRSLARPEPRAARRRRHPLLHLRDGRHDQTLRHRQALHDLHPDVGSARSALTIRSAAARCNRVRGRRGASPRRSQPMAFQCK